MVFVLCHLQAVLNVPSATIMKLVSFRWWFSHLWGGTHCLTMSMAPLLCAARIGTAEMVFAFSRNGLDSSVVSLLLLKPDLLHYSRLNKKY